MTIRWSSATSWYARLIACWECVTDTSIKIGITYVRTSSADYDEDMKRAKAIGIDAMALNIGRDPYTQQQLEFAYESAERNGIKAFISFDFNWYHTDQAADVGQMIAQFANKPAQLKFGERVVASSFAGDGFDVEAMRRAAGNDVWFAPNFHPGQGDFSTIGTLPGFLISVIDISCLCRIIHFTHCCYRWSPKLDGLAERRKQQGAQARCQCYCSGGR
jgi:hypothetical protein